MKMRNLFFVSAVSLMTVLLASCSDDSTPVIQDNCQCPEGQVCSESGTCYDNPECAKCTGDTVCVGGVCYAPTEPCAACDSNQVCVGEECYNLDSPCASCAPEQVCRNNKCLEADDPCAQCSNGQVCRHGKCLDGTDPCFKCSATQICHQGTCYEPDDPCAQCDEAQICHLGKCFEADDPCVQCQETEICYMGECKDAATTCIPACEGLDVCVDGECVPCQKPCAGACCGEGQQCDPVLNTCKNPCTDGSATCKGMCCMRGQICDPSFGCAAVCEQPKTRCDNVSIGISICCAQGSVCEDGLCKEDCRGGVRCNEVCCEVGDVCEENTCKIACDASTHTRCGENEEFCCDNATELCLYNVCLPRGKACETSNHCSFEEFCDESTKTCVLIENVPSTCTVHPATGPFTPKLQWHWPADLPGGKPSTFPDFVQVMNTPSVMNLTDDNGDGKIDENDIPDVIFTAFKTWDYTGDHALRVVSGDTGQEIASYHTTEFRWEHAPAVAKVNHDEYPEIVVRLASGNSKVLNLVPKKDASGYELVDVGTLPGYGARFANLDGSEYPQVITTSGLFRYSEDTNGVGTWTAVCSVGFGGWGGYTIADLDGDGISEIVGSNIYDKDCKKISTDTISGSPALADVDLVDDHENGRLEVEQIMMVAGGTGGNGTLRPAPGTVAVYKVFKNDDGTYRRERVWIKDMPFNYEKANQMLQSYGYKATDGTVATCDKKITDVANSNAASSTNEYKEWRRRYTCQTGGGPLVVADFNGDKKPDIGLVTASSYVVFDAHGDVLWADFTTTDFSSKATGSTLFDFEGDGVSEILYADEVEFHVYKGPGSGVIDAKYGYCSAELLIDPIPNSSGTLNEYPIVVDVDNDGSSEIVIAANDYGNPGVGKQHGVRVFEDPTGHWVRTRRVWNQFDYHVTNINEDGTVPKTEQQSWKVKSLNNFRQNVQPGGLFNAPNLLAESLTSSQDLCEPEAQILALKATLSNKGSLGIRAGLSVRFYADNVNGTSESAFLGEVLVPEILTPGKTLSVTLQWDHMGVLGNSAERVAIETPVDIRFVLDEPKPDKDRGDFIECIEDDNSASASQVKGCPDQVN